MIERIALKPCPFCGGEPHPGTWVDPGDPIGCIPRENWPKNHVLCGCGAQGPQGKSTEAIAAWNNRAALTAIMGEGDGVQQCDRDAADQMLRSADLLTLDRYDQSVAQAFARHRTLAAAAERARIVALLNGINQTETDGKWGWWETSTGAAFGQRILDAIERGEV